MDFTEKIEWLLMSERQDFCEICEQKIEEDVEQEVGYHTTCLQLAPAEMQRLVLLKEKILELNPYLRHIHGELIILLTYVIEDQTIIEINTTCFKAQYVESIPEMITTFPGLKTLSIAEIELPSFLPAMNQLEELVLYGPGIEINIDILRKIKKLHLLYFPQLSESIPEEIFELTNLTELDVSHNEFFDLPESISKLVNLEKLEVLDVRLRTIPESISKLKHLKYLNLSPQGYDKLRFHVFQIIPEFLGNLENLEELIISENDGLTSIPESIGKLRNLRKLNLSYNNLTSLPDTLDQLLNLEEVFLYGNKFEEIPKFLFKLHKTGKLKRVFLTREEFNNDRPSPLFT